MKLNAVRSASARAAAKAKADEDEAKAAENDSEPDEDEDGDEDMDAKAADDDSDTGDDAPNPPTKKKTAKKASAGAISPRAAERQRIQAIMGSEEAEGREDLAEHLAYETEMSAKAAIAMLSKAPQAVVAAAEPAPRQGKSKFAEAMEATARGDAKVAAGKGKGASKSVDEMSDDEYVASIVALTSPFGLTKA